MKKMTWKNIVAGNLVAAACGACLFLLTLPAHAGLLTFDTLGNLDVAIPNGYGNLLWDNFNSLDGAHYYRTSGYLYGVKSKNNVAFNSYGEPASIFVESGSFTPVMAYMTAAWTDKLKLHVQGYLRGRLVLNRTYTLSTTKPLLVVFGVKVDELDFSTSDTSQFVMDNLLVAP
jgi:hypothetical protein